MRVKEYLRKNGSSPYAQWLKGLDGSLKYRVQARILKLKDDEHFGFSKRLAENLYELKFQKLGGGIRIYYGMDGDDLVILLVAEIKAVKKEILNRPLSIGMTIKAEMIRSKPVARRSRDWEESLSKDLQQDQDARKLFFLALIDEGYDWREALSKLIKIIGVNEYAALTDGMKASNLLNQLKPEANITLNTLVKITNPLGIEMTFRDKLDRAS